MLLAPKNSESKTLKSKNEYSKSETYTESYELQCA